MSKVAKQVLFISLAMLASLLLNIVVHEVGHFSAAQSCGFDPKVSVHNESRSVGQVNYLVPTVSTSYFTTPNADNDTLIALAGPAANLMVAAAAFIGFKTSKYKTLCIILLFTASISALINLAPFQGADGAVIFSAF